MKCIAEWRSKQVVGSQKNKLTKHNNIVYSKKQNLKKKSKQKQMSPKKKQKSWADIMDELNY